MTTDQQTDDSVTKPVKLGSRLRNHLIKGAVGSFGIQLGFAGFSFLNAIILARLLGSTGYGVFANAMAWVSLLTIPATFGFGILLVRDTAIYRLQEEWALLKGLLCFSNWFVRVLSVMLALIAAGIAGWMFSSSAQVIMRDTIWIALLLLPLLAQYSLQEGTMRGFECVVRARFPGMIVRPGLLLAGMASIYLFWPNELSAPMVMVVNVGAGVVTLFLSSFFLQGILPKEVDLALPEYTPRPWLKVASLMLVYGGAQIILGQTDIVMLGVLRGAEEVGLYTAASRLAFLLVYVIASIELILMPVMSRLYANGENKKLQKIVTNSVQIAFFLVLPFGLILIFSGDYILSIFGQDFILAQVALILLVIGRLLDVALGSSAPLLSMIGQERIVASVFATISLINVVLNIFLIPIYGLDGAAFSSVFSLILGKLFLSIFVVKRVGIHTTVLFGIFSVINRKIIQ